ncbi:MAG: glycosyltransferase family 2 protein [Chloroflexota bacterium]
MKQIAIIIPALNEAGNIGRLVKATRAVVTTDDLLKASVTVDIVVVDNGSTDDTANEATQAGAMIIHEGRRGYGYACAAGVQAADKADIVVFMDGDFSTLPEELPSLLHPLLEGDADLVLGSRLKGYIEPGAMPPHQRFGNWLVSWLMRLLYKIDVTDLGPYRAIHVPLLKQLQMQEMTFGWPTEMMVKAARQQVKIIEVPVSWHSRQAGRSKVSGTVKGTILATYFILGVTLRYAWGTAKT